MNAAHFFSKYFKIIEHKISSIDICQLEQIAEMVGKINYAGKKVILVGNGGSAAMASHVAVDFTKTAGIRAVNFNEADLITCFSNDYNQESDQLQQGADGICLLHYQKVFVHVHKLN